jgi:prepilin-type N-terminal cleavage/methylation domain-containing protein
MSLWQQERGYTLIEMLVAISISTMLICGELVDQLLEGKWRCYNSAGQYRGSELHRY